jgi:hypothetical protein
MACPPPPPLIDLPLRPSALPIPTHPPHPLAAARRRHCRRWRRGSAFHTTLSSSAWTSRPMRPSPPSPSAARCSRKGWAWRCRCAPPHPWVSRCPSCVALAVEHGGGAGARGAEGGRGGAAAGSCSCQAGSAAPRQNRRGKLGGAPVKLQEQACSGLCPGPAKGNRAEYYPPPPPPSFFSPSPPPSHHSVICACSERRGGCGCGGGG